MAQVRLEGVGKSFGAVEVVKDVDLTIDSGELVVFVGPSGCGKSTLLRLICGLEHLTRGEVLIDDRSMRGVDPSRREVAMVFQSYALYPHMTVADNMAFALRMAGMKRDERMARAAEAAKILRLEDLLDRLPKQLSGGQRQRVAIGRAIVRNPKVFLFDEPLSNLDAELRVQMRMEIANLHRQLGATMIYVTHDQVEAMTMADRIVVLRDGRVVQVGTPMELYERPNSMFIAGFIGSPRMNFLSGRVLEADSGQARIALEGVSGASITLPVAAGVSVGETVRLGVRPEHFVDAARAEMAVEANIEFVENLGGTCYLHAPSYPAGPLVIETRSRAETGVHKVGIDPAACHLFTEEGRCVSLYRN